MSHAVPILPDDPALLKALIAQLQAEKAEIMATLRAHDLLIQTLRMRIAKLKKQVFGKASEKIEREIAQLELALEDLLIASAERETSDTGDDMGDQGPQIAPVAEDVADRPLRRRPRVSPETLREWIELDPGPCCPECGGELRVIGEDTSEMLDLIPAQLKVLSIARPKKSCRSSRADHASASPQPSDLRLHGRPRPSGPCAGLEVR